MADSMKLLPCPMCGGEAALLDYEARYGGLHYASRCPQCTSCGCGMGYLPTATKAVEAWNCRAAMPAPEKAPSFDDARRKLIHCIEQWDGETEYDAEDIAALADDILDVFASPPAREEPPGEGAGDTLTWDQKGSDRDGDPLRFTAALGDMTAEVLLSRGTRLWNVRFSHLDGRLGLASENEAKAYALGSMQAHARKRVASSTSTLAALRNRTSEPEAGAVAVTIFCPVCALPHVDEGEWATTRQHKTHQCQGCGHEWRPFPFAAVGVAHPAPAPATADKLKVAREALEPFARAAGKLDGLWAEDDRRWNDSVRSNVTVRDIRRASQALATLNEQPQ